MIFDNYINGFILDKSKYIELEYKNQGTLSAVGNIITMPSFLKGSTNITGNRNLYILFDDNYDCRYVGIRGSEKIESRLNEHLVKGNTSGTVGTQSKIEKVMNYYNSGKRTIYLLTIDVQPEYMSKAFESWLINHFWEQSSANLPQLCDWNDRD